MRYNRLVKTLIFSDTHLRANFDKNQFDFLKKIILQSDKVIINGDFWDGYYFSFEEFINSEWKKLFPLLKSKDAVYVYGNHDKKKWITQQARLFSTITLDKYTFTSGKYQFTVTHGQLIMKGYEKIAKNRPSSSLVYMPAKLHHYIETIGNNLFGTWFSKLFFYRYFLNKKMIKHSKKNMGENQILVCGHLHYPEFDIKNKYINTGYIRMGFATYILVENGKIQYVKTSY